MLLNANVAFLAIQSVDHGGRTRTPAQLASYLSIITSIGSVVIGLLLLRHHRTKPHDSSDEVVSRIIWSRPSSSLTVIAIGSLSQKPSSGCPRVRNPRNPIQSALCVTALVVSADNPVVVAICCLTLFAGRTIAFTTAFALEALLYSSELWTRLPVGIVLAMMALLISWCVWTSLEAKADYSVLDRVDDLKNRLVDFTRDLRGKTSEHGSDATGGGNNDGQSNSGKLNRSGTLKEAFDRIRWPRPSTSSTLVNRTGSNGSRSTPDKTGVEMGGMSNGEAGNAV